MRTNVAILFLAALQPFSGFQGGGVPSLCIYEIYPDDYSFAAAVSDASLLPSASLSSPSHSDVHSPERPVKTPSSAARREPHTFVNAHFPASWERPKDWQGLQLPPLISTVGRPRVAVAKTPLPKTVQELAAAPPESAGMRPWNVSFAGLQGQQAVARRRKIGSRNRRLMPPGVGSLPSTPEGGRARHSGMGTPPGGGGFFGGTPPAHQVRSRRDSAKPSIPGSQVIGLNG
jgi:hypothetical protein